MLAFIYPTIAFTKTQETITVDRAELTKKTWKAAYDAAVFGQSEIPILDQASLLLPKGYIFVPKKEANALNELWDNGTDEDLVGMILPDNDNDKWHIILIYLNDGYISDDEAKNWNISDLLNSIKKVTEAHNKVSIQNGYDALDVIGWAQEPIYNKSQHQLIYSVLAKLRGASPEDNKMLNYISNVFGRDGRFYLNLVTEDIHITKDKEHLHNILANLKYNKGKRYEDFVEGSDNVAEYGMAALITGVVAKKTGILAMLGIALAKGFKFIIAGVLWLSWKFKNFLQGEKKKR